jgi:hypothetical protein
MCNVLLFSFVVLRLVSHVAATCCGSGALDCVAMAGWANTFLYIGRGPLFIGLLDL